MKPVRLARRQLLRSRARTTLTIGVLFVAVSAEGRPTSVRIKSSSGSELLDDAAIDAVNNWRFEPARRNGVATAGEVLVPVTFKLETS